MAKRILSYIVLIICSVLMIISSSSALSKMLMPFFSSYTLQRGDLYKMSNLPAFKIYKQPCTPSKKETGNTDIYLLGDSFGDMLVKDDFDSIANFIFIHDDNRIKTKLDTTKKNVLVIECVERNLINRFSACTDTTNIIINEDAHGIELQTDYKIGASKYFKLKADQNLQQLLFQDPVSVFFKEAKANMNKNLFGRVDHAVVVSKNEDYLFLSETVDTVKFRKESLSSFIPVPDSLIKIVAKNLDIISSYYKQKGFDEIIFAPIPNKVSVVAPNMGNYNHLIERILQQPSQQFISINPFKAFENSPQQLYYNNDTHWNCAGREVWCNYAEQFF